MKLGGLFGNAGVKAPLARAPKPTTQPGGTSHLEAVLSTAPPKPGEFRIDWGKPAPQAVKDYEVILTLEELEQYLKRCQETGFASFDWETAPSEEARAYYVPRIDTLTSRIEELEAGILQLEGKSDATVTDKGVLKSLKAELSVKKGERKELEETFSKTPFDPHQADICTVSISAKAHESRVIPISHKVGKNIAPELSRDEAREAVLDLMDRYVFTHEPTLKIAVNLAFETKFAARYKRYILGRVADPLMMWVRSMQIAAPGRLNSLSKPHTGWGLKTATKKTFGVTMQDFSQLLQKKGVQFFDEIDASTKEGFIYSAEDADYGLQHYHYWKTIIEQIPGYDKWLHDIEMPFMRVIGIMEFWGMPWNTDTANARYEEALQAQENASEEIKRIIFEATGEEVAPGKTGKTASVKLALFNKMKLPIPKLSDKTGNASLDEEALIDMRFMLENKLESIDEEKYLAIPLPEGWEDIEPDANYGEPGFNGDITKQERGAIRIKKREFHPFKDAGIALIEQMMKIQKYTTLISSHIVGRQKYLNPFTDRIHAGYSSFTDTGRLNSFKPNGQNVPRPDNDDFKIRSFFAPKPGKILFFIDFSGFELRLIAWKSNDEVMIELFNTNGDMHRRTASALTGKPESDITKIERTNAKAGNFGIAYGGTEYALQKTFKTDYGVRKTLDECAAIVNAVKTAYPRIPQMQRQAILDARENGYAETIYGYKRLLRDINGTNSKLRGSDERRAGNTPIQGSAADIMKDCQNKVYDRIGEDTFKQRQGETDVLFTHGSIDMIAQIHDEMIFEMDDDPALVEKAGAWIKAIMERPPLPDFPVPVIAEASVGKDWGTKIDLEEWVNAQEEVAR